MHTPKQRKMSLRDALASEHYVVNKTHIVEFNMMNGG